MQQKNYGIGNVLIFYSFKSDMTVDDVRDYEKKAQDRTNEKLIQENKEIIDNSGNDSSKNGNSPPKASNNKKGSSTRV